MGWIKGANLWIRRGREDEGAVFVVRKRLGIAVERNRLKRRLRVICRDLEVLQGSLVVLPQLSAVRTSFATLQRELRELVCCLNGSARR